MSNRSERTGFTDLTDAELSILDIAAIQGGYRRMYYPDAFPYQFNCPPHGLSLDELLETLDRFERYGLLESTDVADDRATSLGRAVRATAEGGRLWEQERRPDWSRFVIATYHGRVDAHRTRFTIYGHSFKVCHSFFHTACDTEMLDYRGGQTRRASGIRALIWWRPAQRVHMLSAWLESWVCNADWQRFETERCWWSKPHEIATLWDQPPASPAA